MLSNKDANKILNAIGKQYRESTPMHAACVSDLPVSCASCGQVAYVCVSAGVNRCGRCGSDQIARLPTN